jgi:peptidoglycan/LPS O-acetylase OafA/YrhL
VLRIALALNLVAVPLDQARTTFDTRFASDVARELGLQPAGVFITGIRLGSVVVDFELHSSAITLQSTLVAIEGLRKRIASASVMVADAYVLQMTILGPDKPSIFSNNVAVQHMNLVHNVAVIGDSMCMHMRPPLSRSGVNLYDMLRQATGQRLVEKMADIEHTVNFEFVCHAGKRLATCDIDCSETGDAAVYWQGLDDTSKRAYSDLFGRGQSGPWPDMCEASSAACSTGIADVQNICEAAVPNVIVIMLGTDDLNSLLWKGGAGQARLSSNIDALVKAAQQYCGVSIPIVVVAPMTFAVGTNTEDPCQHLWTCDDNRRNWLTTEMSRVVGAVNASTSRFIDTVDFAKSYETSDGTHYTGFTSASAVVTAVAAEISGQICYARARIAIGDRQALSFCGLHDGEEDLCKVGGVITMTITGGYTSNEPNAFCNETLDSTNSAAGMNPAENNEACAQRDMVDVPSSLWIIVVICLFPLLIVEVALIGLVCCAERAPSDEEGRTEDPQHYRTIGKSLPIEGLRVIAAVHIVIFHLNQTFTSGPTTFQCSFCGFGKYWVQSFFMISGYMCALSHLSKPESQRPKIVRFMFNRILPLYPLYLLSIVVALIGRAATEPSIPGSRVDIDAGHVVLSVFMLQSWVPPFHVPINGPGWFVSNLFLFWMLFPHWINLASRTRRQRDMVILMVLCWLSSFAPHLICYIFFDMPLYKRWYGNNIHNVRAPAGCNFEQRILKCVLFWLQFIEFHPLANWPSYFSSILLARLVTCQNFESAHRVMYAVGGTAVMFIMLIFFIVADPPGFEMGTYELLIDKGPLAIPLLVRSSVC